MQFTMYFLGFLPEAVSTQTEPQVTNIHDLPLVPPPSPPHPTVTNPPVSRSAPPVSGSAPPVHEQLYAPVDAEVGLVLICSLLSEIFDYMMFLSDWSRTNNTVKPPIRGTDLTLT